MAHWLDSKEEQSKAIRANKCHPQNWTESLVFHSIGQSSYKPSHVAMCMGTSRGSGLQKVCFAGVIEAIVY